MELNKDDFNELCKKLTLNMTDQFDIISKLGFTNIGDLVRYMEKYTQ